MAEERSVRRRMNAQAEGYQSMSKPFLLILHVTCTCLADLDGALGARVSEGGLAPLAKL